MGTVLSVLLAPGCSPAVAPPPGVPDTPYWYVVGDSTYWYQPADSLATVELQEGAPSDSAEMILYDLRDMGWRMTALRGPALRHAGMYQELAQNVFQVERLADAVSPVTDWGAFEKRFKPEGKAGDGSIFMSLLPGLKDRGEGKTIYYWPSCAGVTWSHKTTAVEAAAWLDSLGCRVLTSPQVGNTYYVDRSWAIELPPGAQLFDWLRKLNSDPRVVAAHPISALADPPFPDARQIRDAEREPDPPEFERMAPALRRAYWIAHFAGNPVYATRVTHIPSRFDKFNVIITREQGDETPPEVLVERYGGRLGLSHENRIDAWIPYSRLPDLATDPAVKNISAAPQREGQFNPGN